jgi:hypothetical protein
MEPKKLKIINMKDNIKRAEQLKSLSEALYNEYTEELFTNDSERHVKLCAEVIRHEGSEKLSLDDLHDVEVYFVKNTVKGLYTNLSLNNGKR